MQPLPLSKADSKVLAQVFDPESGPTAAEVLVDPSLPSDRHVLDTSLLTDLRSQEKNAIRLIEAYAHGRDKHPDTRERTYRNALEILDRVISEHPDYASARNNRAQLRRWRFGDRNLLCRSPSTPDPDRDQAATDAIEDLRMSISLASPAKPQDAVSPGQGKLLSQAHTQLGALYYAAAKDLGQFEETEVVCPGMRNWTKDAYEEEASRSFYLGGLYGNEVAKALAVHTNPHAKLCGSIVKEAMRKEFAQAY